MTCFTYRFDIIATCFYFVVNWLSFQAVFEFTKDQKTIRKDLFKRYGTNVNALSKIVTRISNLESQFRKVRYENDNYLRDIYKKVGENFVRYSLSN